MIITMDLFMKKIKDVFVLYYQIIIASVYVIV